jgi:hypothetical protein
MRPASGLVKPAEVRFYFDADILGLGKLIASLRPDCTYPGDPGATIHRRQRPACVVTTPRARDTEWIPAVSEAGLLVITRDRQIQQHRAEITAAWDAGARMVALSAEDAGTTWAQLEIVMTLWRRIEGLADLPGPFVYTATRTSLTKVV